jgi:cobalamin biosynthesis protein CbiG
MQHDLSHAVWTKSSHSGPNGNCVEVARNLPGTVAVRDSKDPDGPVLILTRRQWRALTEGMTGAQSAI